MAKIIRDEQIHLEPGLFSQGFVAGEFAFVAQDARRSHGALTDESTRDQARQTVENLDAALKTADMNLTDVVSLMVYLPDYSDAGLVCEVLDAAFGKDGETRPAATLVGIAGLVARTGQAVNTPDVDWRPPGFSPARIATGSRQPMPRSTRRKFCLFVRCRRR